MNITSISLVVVATSADFVVMCETLNDMIVIAFFECAHINSTFLIRNLLLLVLISNIFNMKVECKWCRATRSMFQFKISIFVYWFNCKHVVTCSASSYMTNSKNYQLSRCNLYWT